jgi:hypothetical protein
LYYDCNTETSRTQKIRGVQVLKKSNGESVPTPTARKTPDRRERGLLTASQALLTKQLNAESVI